MNIKPLEILVIGLTAILLKADLHSQTKETYRIQINSEKPKGSDSTIVKAEAHYPVSPDSMWNILSRPEIFPTFVPRVKSVDVLDPSEGSEKLFMSMDLPATTHRGTYSIKKNHTSRVLEWELNDTTSMIITKNIGNVSVMEEEGGCVARIEVSVTLGFLLPDALATWGAMQFLPKVLVVFGQRSQNLLPLKSE